MNHISSSVRSVSLASLRGGQRPREVPLQVVPLQSALPHPLQHGVRRVRVVEQKAPPIAEVRLHEGLLEIKTSFGAEEREVVPLGSAEVPDHRRRHLPRGLDPQPVPPELVYVFRERVQARRGQERPYREAGERAQLHGELLLRCRERAHEVGDLLQRRRFVQCVRSSLEVCASSRPGNPGARR